MAQCPAAVRRHNLHRRPVKPRGRRQNALVLPFQQRQPLLALCLHGLQCRAAMQNIQQLLIAAAAAMTRNQARLQESSPQSIRLRHPPHLESASATDFSRPGGLGGLQPHADAAGFAAGVGGGLQQRRAMRLHSSTCIHKAKIP